MTNMIQLSISQGAIADKNTEKNESIDELSDPSVEPEKIALGLMVSVNATKKTVSQEKDAQNTKNVPYYFP